jgi:hypothetical protein
LKISFSKLYSRMASKPGPGKKKAGAEALTVANLHPPYPSEPLPLPPGAPLPVTLPPREAQHALTLVGAEAQGVVRELPAVAWLDRYGSAALATHPDAQRLIVGAFSGRILDHAHEVRESLQRARGWGAPVDLLGAPPPPVPAATRKEPKRGRVAADGNLIGSYVSTLERIVPASAAELAHMHVFYANADDGFDEETPFGGQDPDSYPMFKLLTETYWKWHEQRDVAPGSAEAAYAKIPELSREEQRVFRMPPLPGGRTCSKGQSCIGIRKFPQDADKSCVLREFYLGKRPPAAGTPLGLCLDDTLDAYRKRWYMNVEQGYTPPEPFNAFRVLCGAGQYAQDCTLPQEIDGRVTGIGGFVPAYDVKQRKWERVPEEDVEKYGLPRNRSLYYMAEINVGPVEHVGIPAVRAHPD